MPPQERCLHIPKKLYINLCGVVSIPPYPAIAGCLCHGARLDCSRLGSRPNCLNCPVTCTFSKSMLSVLRSSDQSSQCACIKVWSVSRIGTHIKLCRRHKRPALTSGTMDTQTLYDLLRSLSHAGREVAAQQQGLAGNGRISCDTLHAEDVHIIKCFAERPVAHTAVWQGMPQAGISLSDIARCCFRSSMYSKARVQCATPELCVFYRCLNDLMLHGTQQTATEAAVIFSYLIKTPSCPVSSCCATLTLASKCGHVKRLCCRQALPVNSGL